MMQMVGSINDARQEKGRSFALADMLARLPEVAGGAHHYLLLMRFVLLNVVAFAFLGMAGLQGWLHVVWQADSSRLVAVIAAVFLLGLVLCATRIVSISGELNALKQDEPKDGTRVQAYLQVARRLDAQSRANIASSLRLKLVSRIAMIKHLANSLVVLGLIGTVLGFIVALSGVDPAAVASVDAVAPMVSRLIAGMSIALYTTLVGAILNVWLMLNYRLLEGGAVSLVTGLVERGERCHARF